MDWCFISSHVKAVIERVALVWALSDWLEMLSAVMKWLCVAHIVKMTVGVCL